MQKKSNKRTNPKSRKHLRTLHRQAPVVWLHFESKFFLDGQLQGMHLLKPNHPEGHFSVRCDSQWGP